MYHGQSSETTEGSLNARVERLPWINDRVRELIGARRPEGRRVLQTLHLALLAHLHLRYPEGEATLTRSDILDWLECEDSTPRRILNELRRAGLIEYRAGRRGVCHIAAPAVTQPALPLEVTPAESLRNHSGISAESARNHGSPTPPPDSVPEGDSLLGTPDHESARKNSCRVGAARAREENSANGFRMADHLLPQLRERREQVLGRSRLAPSEWEECRRFFRAGGTMLDVDEAIQVWEDDGRRSLGSFVYILRIAGKAVSARNEFVADGGAAPDPPNSQPAAGAANTPGYRAGGRFANPRPGRGPARQETMAEQHDRLMRELEESRANGNGRRGF